MPARVDALGVTPVFLAAVDASPDVLEVDIVAVSGRDLDPAAVERVVFERVLAFAAPGLEASAVWLVADVRDDVVC